VIALKYFAKNCYAISPFFTDEILSKELRNNGPNKIDSNVIEVQFCFCKHLKVFPGAVQSYSYRLSDISLSSYPRQSSGSNVTAYVTGYSNLSVWNMQWLIDEVDKRSCGFWF